MTTDGMIVLGGIAIVAMGVAGAPAVWIVGVCVAVLAIALIGGAREYDRAMKDLEQWNGLIDDGEA